MVDEAPPHPEPPVAGSELDTLLGSLERQRATLAWKTEGLDDDALQWQLQPSAITLGGLLTHLAFVEEVYFQYRLMHRSPADPWGSMDWEDDPDRDWHLAPTIGGDEARALWRDAVDHSRATAAEWVADGGDAGTLARYTWPDGRTPAMRRILADLVEEYARHVGHADLIREAIDGRVGEDPPGDAFEYRLG